MEVEKSDYSFLCKKDIKTFSFFLFFKQLRKIERNMRLKINIFRIVNMLRFFTITEKVFHVFPLGFIACLIRYMGGNLVPSDKKLLITLKIIIFPFTRLLGSFFLHSIESQEIVWRKPHGYAPSVPGIQVCSYIFPFHRRVNCDVNTLILSRCNRCYGQFFIRFVIWRKIKRTARDELEHEMNKCRKIELLTNEIESE